MTERKSNYMHVASGGKYFPFEPQQHEVYLEDIAHALASKARYNGHTVFPIWVGQHSVYTALVSVPGHNTPKERFARLMHDASEAYIGDLIRPLKYSAEFSAPFKKVEELNEEVISKAFGLPFPFEPHVKIADEMVTAAEVNQLICKRADLNFDRPLHDASKVADIVIKEWNWKWTSMVFKGLAKILHRAERSEKEFEFWNSDLDLYHMDDLERYMSSGSTMTVATHSRFIA